MSYDFSGLKNEATALAQAQAVLNEVVSDIVIDRLDRIIELLEKLCELTSSHSYTIPPISPKPLLPSPEAEQAMKPTGYFSDSRFQPGQKPPQAAPSGTTESKNSPKRSKP